MSCSLVMSMSWSYIIHDACLSEAVFSPDFKFWLCQHSNSSPGDLEGCRRTNTLHVFTEHFTWKMLAFGTEARSDSAPLSLMAGTTLGDGDVGTGTRAWDVKSDIEAQGTEGPVSYKFPKGKPLSNKMPYETKLWSSEISHLLWKTQVQVSVSFFSDNSITQNSEMGIRNGKKTLGPSILHSLRLSKHMEAGSSLQHLSCERVWCVVWAIKSVLVNCTAQVQGKVALLLLLLVLAVWQTPRFMMPSKLAQPHRRTKVHSTAACMDPTTFACIASVVKCLAA